MQDLFFSSDALMLKDFVKGSKKGCTTSKKPYGLGPENTKLDLAVRERNSKNVNEYLKKAIPANYPDRVASFLLQTKDEYQYESLYLFSKAQSQLQPTSQNRLTEDALDQVLNYFQFLRKEKAIIAFKAIDDALPFIKPLDLIHLMVEYDEPYLHTYQGKLFAVKDREDSIISPEEASCCRIL